MKKLVLAAALLSIAVALSMLERPGDETDSPLPGEPMTPAVESNRAAAVTEPDRTTEAGYEFDDDTEMVLGIRVRKDRNCTVELRDYVTPDGEMFSAYSCTPNEPGPEHPYTHYTDATLATMAYSDAEAAALLGKRLIERDTGRSYEMLIRATALDGDFGHLAWLADQAFGITAIDGEPQVENLKRQYELAAIATHFGDFSGRAAYFRDELVRIGVTDGQLQSLDERVSEVLRSIREIQVTVHGKSTIGGHGDA